MQQVSENVYAETEFRGCNPGYVVTSEGVVMIDTPQRPSDAVKWREEIARLGEVRYLINTEHHGDHIVGNFFFDTTVVSHEGIRKIFAESIGPIDQLTERIRLMDPDGVSLIANYRPNPPTITFNSRLTLHVGNHTFHLIHLPGHTPHETAVLIPEERLVFTGDNIFNNSQPFLHQCKPLKWLDALDKIERMDVDVLVPGHGEICDKSAIGPLRAYIQDMIDEVEKAIDEELSREQTVDRISTMTTFDRFPVPAYMSDFAPELRRMNAMRVYDELIARRKRAQRGR